MHPSANVDQETWKWGAGGVQRRCKATKNHLFSVAGFSLTELYGEWMVGVKRNGVLCTCLSVSSRAPVKGARVFPHPEFRPSAAGTAALPTHEPVHLSIPTGCIRTTVRSL